MRRTFQFVLSTPQSAVLSINTFHTRYRKVIGRVSEDGGVGLPGANDAGT
ncbi:hypothetical protein ACN9ML_28035 [Dyadobacter endophyticus]|nr:hypothetical protein [Dyadobacter endophyticus]